MSVSSLFVCILLVLLCLFPVFSVGLPYFLVDEGTRRCFLEEVPEDMLIVGRYHNLDWLLLSPSSISIEVHDSRSNVILHHETIEQGQFGFTSIIAGEHQICVTASSTPSSYGQMKTFRFEMVLDFGEQAQDYSSIAKAEHLSAIEVEVRKLNDKLKMIRNEQQYQKSREAEFRDTSESINSSVVYWSVIQTVLLFAAGLGQLYLLTKFFKSKKLA